MLQASAEKNFVVCDPFVGSGSSMVSAIKFGCNFIGADICEKACKMTSERAKQFTDFGQDIYQK
jgi:site-specific DNA-methyltransferase (adenine-specific)